MDRADEGDTTRPPALDLIFSGLDQLDRMFSGSWCLWSIRLDRVNKP